MLVFHCLITKKKSPTTRLIKTRQAVFYTAPMKSEPGRERESYDGKPIYSGTGLQMVGMGYHFSCLNFSVSSCRSSATSHSDPTVVFSPVVNPIVTYTTGYRRHSHDKGRATILMNCHKTRQTLQYIPKQHAGLYTGFLLLGNFPSQLQLPPACWVGIPWSAAAQTYTHVQF